MLRLALCSAEEEPATPPRNGNPPCRARTDRGRSLHARRASHLAPPASTRRMGKLPHPTPPPPSPLLSCQLPASPPAQGRPTLPSPPTRPRQTAEPGTRSPRIHHPRPRRRRHRSPPPPGKRGYARGARRRRRRAARGGCAAEQAQAVAGLVEDAEAAAHAEGVDQALLEPRRWRRGGPAGATGRGRCTRR